MAGHAHRCQLADVLRKWDQSQHCSEGLPLECPIQCSYEDELASICPAFSILCNICTAQ